MLVRLRSPGGVGPGATSAAAAAERKGRRRRRSRRGTTVCEAICLGEKWGTLDAWYSEPDCQRGVPTWWVFVGRSEVDVDP